MRSVDGKALSIVKHPIDCLPGPEAVVGIAPGVLFRGGLVLVQICNRDIEGPDRIWKDQIRSKIIRLADRLI